MCKGPACVCCVDFNITFIDLGGPGEYKNNNELLTLNGSTRIYLCVGSLDHGTLRSRRAPFQKFCHEKALNPQQPAISGITAVLTRQHKNK